MEKGPYNVDDKPGFTGSDEHQAKTGRLAEAADLYGNVEEAEQLGYVTRGLDPNDSQLPKHELTHDTIDSNRDISNS